MGVPIGTGIIYPGMNDARVHDNWIFDNWRDGAMLFAVPDALTNGGGAEGDIFPGVSCPGAPANGFSTSCGNQFFRNRVGRAPNGFRFPDAIDMFGNVHAHDDARPKKPNGNDFWWSELFASNTGNCWFDNTGFDGTAASVTGPGDAGRLPGDPPQVLPSDCATSVGNNDFAKLVYLVDCGNGPDEDTGPTDCDWWTLPPRPGTAAAQSTALSRARAARAFEQSPEADALRKRVAELMPLTGVSRSGRAMLVLAAAVVALPACGADDDGASRDEGAPVDIRGVGLVSGNSTAQFANCRDWRRGSVKRRYATIEDIRGQLTPQSSRSAASDLSDEAAYRVFQHACAADFSDKLRLYKLYAHAQAFAPLTKDAGEADPAP